MGIVFKKKWFNPLFFILNDILKDETVRTVFIFGGKSSAKTYTVSQILSKELVVKQASSIAFRKESATIDTTLKKSFSAAVDSTYLYPAVKKMDRKYTTEAAEIVFRGLDDEEKAKGVESYKYLLFDELNQFEEGEYDQAEMSLRGLPGQKIFATWNPVSDQSWVKLNLVDKQEWVDTDYKLPCDNSYVKRSKCGLFILIKTTYEDNFWISGSEGKKYVVRGVETVVTEKYGYYDTNLIAKYNAMKLKNFNRYKVEVLGLWGKVVFGGEILKKWKSEVHVGEHKYDPEQAIYLSFDENVNPYFPCAFFQVGRDCKSPRMIHVLTMTNPANTVKEMCREITRILRRYKHEGHVYIGGDATSKKEDVKQEKGHDLFKLLMLGLAEFKPTKRVISSNPSVRVSTDFFNEILEGEIEGLTFGVDESCTMAVLDFENTKEDKNGGVDKTTVEDRVTKVRYQPYGHIFDLTRYFLVGTFKEEYLKYQTGGQIQHKFSGGRNTSANNF